LERSFLNKLRKRPEFIACFSSVSDDAGQGFGGLTPVLSRIAAVTIMEKDDRAGLETGPDTAANF
jgi:hypothetical protein